MAEILSVTRDHTAPNSLAGDDQIETFTATAPPGEGFFLARVEILSQVRGGANVKTEPAVGTTGTFEVKVGWWYDGALPPHAPSDVKGNVKYRLRVFSGRPQPFLSYARFKCSNDLYLGAVSGGGGAVDALAAQADERARFILIGPQSETLSDGNIVHLLAPSGDYVCAEGGGGGAVNANRPEPLQWETFIIRPATDNAPIVNGSTIMLVSTTGGHLRRTTAGGTNASGTRTQAASRFTLEITDGFDRRLPSTGREPVGRFWYFDDATRHLMDLNGVSCGGIAIFKDGAPVLRRAHGYADRERSRPALPSTLMRLASVDKPVTKVAIETWMADPARNVNKQTPVFPFLRGLGVQAAGPVASGIDNITFEHLLKGTSRIPQRLDSGITAEAQAAEVMTRQLDMSHEGAVHYPNLDYELLRFAMLKQLGGRQGFVDFLRNQVFGPTGSRDVDIMADSGGAKSARETWYDGGSEDSPNRALLLTASVNALGCLFSRFRILDGRPFGADCPKISAIEVIRSSTPPETYYRINCGGARFKDSSNRTWNEDPLPFTNASWQFSNTSAITGTPDDVLYQSERAGIVEYKMGIPPGNYTVRLHFAELTHDAVGRRVFNVALNENTVLRSYDIFAATGKNRATVRSFAITIGSAAMLRISAYPDWAIDPSWNGTATDSYFGGLAGTLCLVDQVINRRIVNVANFNKRNDVFMDVIKDILRAGTLIDDPEWP